MKDYSGLGIDEEKRANAMCLIEVSNSQEVVIDGHCGFRSVTAMKLAVRREVKSLGQVGERELRFCSDAITISRKSDFN